MGYSERTAYVPSRLNTVNGRTVQKVPWYACFVRYCVDQPSDHFTHRDYVQQPAPRSPPPCLLAPLLTMPHGFGSRYAARLDAASHSMIASPGLHCIGSKLIPQLRRWHWEIVEVSVRGACPNPPFLSPSPPIARSRQCMHQRQVHAVGCLHPLQSTVPSYLSLMTYRRSTPVTNSAPRLPALTGSSSSCCCSST